MTFEERPSTLFQPDVLAVYDFASRTEKGQNPEERLMMAVLGDALFCFQKYHAAPDKLGRKIFSDAENWMLQEDEEWPFSFANICSTLGISPTYLRGQLMRWKTTHHGGASRSRANMKLVFNKVQSATFKTSQRPLERSRFPANKRI
jgi:hypothetical protein